VGPTMSWHKTHWRLVSCCFWLHSRDQSHYFSLTKNTMFLSVSSPSSFSVALTYTIPR
jgi:hypothetical protein